MSRPAAILTWAGLVLGAGSLIVAGFVAVPLFAAAPLASTGEASSQSIVRTAPPEPAPGQPAAVTPQASSRPASGPGSTTRRLVAGQPLRLTMPAVGLDATVGSMTVAPGGSVDPPTPGSAYWLDSSSVAGPSSTGTTYIAGHTYRGGGQAVFNPFLDIPHSRYTVEKGDRVIVATTTGTWGYTVTDTELYLKTTVQQQKKLWQNVPGRLVLVTCFQYEGGTSSQQNFVVYAQRDD